MPNENEMNVVVHPSDMYAQANVDEPQQPHTLDLEEYFMNAFAA
jgi:hypothetical protein